jgi:hypothetical protein
MVSNVELVAADGHRLSAYLAPAQGRPRVSIMFPAGHGFNCTERRSFEPVSAALALERSLEFLHQNIG